VRTPSRAFAGTTALLVSAALVLAAGPGGQAAPPGAPDPAQAQQLPGDHAEGKTKDNRKGLVSPTGRQRERAANIGARAR
jgi:hypothetical protein